VVGDHVVQLAGDPQPLLDDGVLLELGRLRPQRLRLGGESGAAAGGVPRGLAAEDGAAEVDDVDEERIDDGAEDRVDRAAGRLGSASSSVIWATALPRRNWYASQPNISSSTPPMTSSATRRSRAHAMALNRAKK
jgi:hypothetical protein